MENRCQGCKDNKVLFDATKALIKLNVTLTERLEAQEKFITKLLQENANCMCQRGKDNE